MRVPLAILLSGLTLLALAGAAAGSEPAEPPSGSGASTRHWAIGWDSGVAFRHWMSGSWGVGLRLNPNLVRSNSKEEDRSLWEEGEEGAPISRESRDFGSRSYGIGFMLFREVSVGDWLSVGPYGGVSFDYESSRRDEVAVYESGTGTGWRGRLDETSDREFSRTWALECGIRPVFRLHRRFLLETRLGLRASYRNDDDNTRRDRLERTLTEEHLSTEEDRTNYNSWSFSAFGQDLGPGATMQFMILF